MAFAQACQLGSRARIQSRPAMMNIQNPAHYPPQQVYTGYGNAMAQPPGQPSSYPADFSQGQLQQPFPQTPQRPNQFAQQSASQIPPHVYQQLQQQHQQHQQHQQQQGFGRPNSRGNNGMIPGQQQRQSPQGIPSGSQNHIQNSNPNQPPIQRSNGPHTPTSAPQIPNNMAMATQMQQSMAGAGLAQQAQLQNAVQQMNRSTPAQQQQPSAQAQAQAQAQAPNQTANTPLSPQTASREKARVTVLLEINSHLLQEVISLQSQGKAGPVTQQPNTSTQQSPTSPSSAATENANTFSPTDQTPQTKATGPPSKEYQDCMRRLQANLSYLAAIADAKKRPDGKVPTHPQIIYPPPHLKDVHDLYKKLAVLFPEAGQSKTNQAIAFASAQHQQNNQTGGQPVGQQNMGMSGFPNANMTNGSNQQGQQMVPGQGLGHG